MVLNLNPFRENYWSIFLISETKRRIHEILKRLAIGNLVFFNTFVSLLSGHRHNQTFMILSERGVCRKNLKGDE